MADAVEFRHLEDRQTQVLLAISGLHSRVFGQAFVDLELRQMTIAQRISSLCDALHLQECGVNTTSEIEGRDGIGTCMSREGESVKLGRKFRYAEQNEDIICNDVLETGGGTHRALDTVHHNGENVEKRLTRILADLRASFLFKRVPSDYYARSFEERRDLLGAASIDHLCKSIVMMDERQCLYPTLESLVAGDMDYSSILSEAVNTQSHESLKDCSDRSNSKYYVVIVQYTARLNAEKVRHFVYTLNDGKIPKKRFNFRLAPEETSSRLTGFEHNAVTPFGMLTNIPVIISDCIVKLEPDFFWLGGGEVDLKLGIKICDFMNIIKPVVVDCTH